MSTREAVNAQEKGIRRYKNQVERESRRADSSGNLPFTFSKPKKERARNIRVICDKCGHEMFVSEITVIVICSACNSLVKIKGE